MPVSLARGAVRPAGIRTHASHPPARAPRVRVRDSFTELDTVTVPEVMERLRVGRHKVYDLFRSHELPSIKVGNSRRVPATALAAYLAQQLGESN